MTGAQRILVLGGGVGGIVAANDLRRRLPARHEIVLVDREETFVFAPSLLWLLVGARRPEQISRPLRRLVRRGVAMLFATIAMLMASTSPTIGGSAGRASTLANSSPPTLAPGDTIAAGHLIKSEALARLLPDSTAGRPVVLQVGFKVLFRSGHIPGSRYLGPASKPEGLASLKQALRGIPRQQPLVLYCGCCPWTDCPNVRPAYRVAREMGFKDVRVLYVAKNLQHDWIDKGLPVGEGDQ